MNYGRGSVVVCVVAGDYGKPRPAVIVQSERVEEQDCDSVLVCPITSTVTYKPFRFVVQPTEFNGLHELSEIMTEKLVAVRRDKIHQYIGALMQPQQEHLNELLKLLLSLN